MLLRGHINFSVIIPAFNEERHIACTIKACSEYMYKRRYSFELIVVDDGSFDTTCQIIEDLQKRNNHLYLLKNERNYGKGYSVRRGIAAATGEIMRLLLNVRL